ncbi:MAG: hypothetical protein NVSMB64_12880 [Candidatus Velthaea sp.]
MSGNFLRTALGITAAFSTLCSGAVAAPVQHAVPANAPAAYVGAFSTGTVGRLTVATSANDTVMTASTFTNVPAMITTITVPAFKRAVLVARFSAETACVGRDTTWCSIRILVDGAEASPAAGFQYAFSTVNPGAPGGYMWQGNSMDRAAEVGPGVHTINVQAATTDTSQATTFWLGERTLVVESAIH